MSSPASTIALWTSEKTVALTGHSRHRHEPSPVAPGFLAPPPSSSLSFGPAALAAAIARTATLRDAPAELLMGLGRSALAQTRCLIANGDTFELSPHLKCLADTERTIFAARVGAGIADLYMNTLGYTWRDNAAGLSSALEPHADFIYDGGNAGGYGVVLAEAHGSFTEVVTAPIISARAKRKYARQVKPHVAAPCRHGQIIHGYSIAFGSRPGASGAFLSVAETDIRRARASPFAPASPETTATSFTTPTPLVLAAHRSNFCLMGASSIVEWIDWVRALAARPDDTTPPVAFFRFPYAGRTYLVSVDFLWPSGFRHFWFEEGSEHHFWWRRFYTEAPSRPHAKDPPLGWFVIEENAGERFLEALSGIIRDGRERAPDQLELPTMEPAGFSTSDDGAPIRGEDSAYRYALFRDGLALLEGPPPRTLLGIRRWSPTGGLTRSQRG